MMRACRTRARGAICMSRSSTARLSAALSVVALAAACAAAPPPPADEPLDPEPPYLVGAYYYSWYTPEHWQLYGHAGRHLPQPLESRFGEYRSDDPRVIAAHVRWAAQYGIDFFIISWSQRGNFADYAARDRLLPALAASRVRQAPLIELVAYQGQDVGSERLRRRLAADLAFVAEHYLRHPSALTVDGRPVLFLYATRAFRGDITAWTGEVRRVLEAAGVTPFIVADEAFWQEVDPARVRAFDAVTAYNVYEWPRRGHAGWARDSTFFAEVDGMFARWQAALRQEGIPFVPNAMPGYNDRGVRLEENHYVIPRRLHAGGTITGFFERSLDLARRYADPALRMVTVTSFNEWHEWTQIEPARRSDRAAAGDAARYTEGFPHDAYGFEYLEVLRERFGDVPATRAYTAADPETE